MAQTFKPLAALKKFLATPDMPVSNQEMSEFWGTLTEAEKEEFRKFAEKYLPEK